MSWVLQILELDAEIRHAFSDLQDKDECSKELQIQVDFLKAELNSAHCKLENAQAELKTCHAEMDAATSQYKHKLVSLFHSFVSFEADF
jgi:flagellar capping protein FliD